MHTHTQMHTHTYTHAHNDTHTHTYTYTEKCFPYVTIPELRAVPVEILSKLPRVPVAYFAEIAKDAKLMSELPLAVRRQVWVQKANPELFKSYILSLIRQYSLQPQMLGLVTGIKGASTKLKKARAANKPLQDIVSACADVAPLYRETLDIIGQAYLDNPSDLALCSLRLQVSFASIVGLFCLTRRSLLRLSSLTTPVIWRCAPSASRYVKRDLL
jgi:hypothetical protein